ncbi:MAG: SRPBCC family protein [Betaproteobacteria bacterium]
MIEISERIEVAAPPSAVWAILSDPRAVVECVPGASLGDAHDDGTFDATMVVKFGPAKVTFQVRVALELDEAACSGHVTSRGKDNQGGTRVRASMRFKATEQSDPPGTVIPIDAEVEITGRLASLVESGAKIVVKRMTADFTERLAARCRDLSTGETA